MTDPAHALIITPSGTTAITNLLSGTGLGVTNAALAGFATFVINFIKVAFAIAFIFGIKDAYDKTRERAELQEVIQAPIVHNCCRHRDRCGDGDDFRGSLILHLALDVNILVEWGKGEGVKGKGIRLWRALHIRQPLSVNPSFPLSCLAAWCNAR